MIPFSTPFDATAVDFLEQLGVPCYKIASFENTDLPLIRQVAATGKPMIISTGMATVADIDEAVRAAREAGCRDLVLLKCTSTYPAAPVDTNLLTIPHMRGAVWLRGRIVGPHVRASGQALPASRSAQALSRSILPCRAPMAGLNSTFSMEPSEMASLVVETERAWTALGEVHYGLTEKEQKSQIFRRSLYVAEDMAAGDALTESNLRIIRPGLGLPPKYFETLIGRRVGRAVRRGTPMSWELLTSADDDHAVGTELAAGRSCLTSRMSA